MADDDVYWYDDVGSEGDSGSIPDVDYESDEDNDESGPRFAWKVTSIIIVVLTLLLNLILIGVILVKKTSGNDLINKGKQTTQIRKKLHVKMRTPLLKNPIFVSYCDDTHH